MATLERIRSKSGLLIVVIGLALLAFIIGDAITNSRNIFGDQSTVAKIGGQKIDYTDYIRKREELNNQLEMARRQNPAQYANFDAQTLSQMALDNLVGEALLDQAADDAGIRTSSNQLSFYVLENPVNPSIRDIIQQLNQAGYNVATPQQAYELIFNPKRNGATEAQMAPFQRAWVAMEHETVQMVKRNTYQRLLMGTVKANDLDKKALYNDYVSTKNVDVAYLPYGQLDPEKYPVDDSAIRSEYENVKNRYSVEEPTKDIAFIAVNISPSQADREAASKLARQTVASMSANNGQVDKELRKEGIAVTHKELRAADLPNGAVKDFVLSAPMDSVKILKENISGFTIVRMGKKIQAIDSIQLNLVQVAGEALAPKVLARLNSGLSVDSLHTVYSTDSVMAQKDQWFALYNNQGKTNALDNSQLDTLLMAGGKYVSLLNTPQVSVLAQLTKKNNPVEIYEFDQVDYDLKPSTQTVNEERIKLEDYLTANNTSAEFTKNAASGGYSVRNLSLASSSPAVPRMAGMQSFYPDSRQVVRWVMMDGKPGAVSHVYESKDALKPALYAVAVLNEYDDYVPLTNGEVKNFVSDRVRKSKAGDDMVAKYQPSASTMQDAANAMGVEPKNNAVFRFGRNPQVRDAAVMGKIAGSQPGNVVVVKGDNGVYAYQIISTNTETFPFNDNQYEQQYFQLVNPNMGEMLRGSKKLNNNIYKFEAGD